MGIRNIAIVAHVDHGKTTLVDGLLRQSGTLDDRGAQGTCVMDSSDQERERGITILSKNTAVVYKGHTINIVDTPGHADFSSEVERVLRMVDAVMLLVDAAEGPMPQTRFVLRKSLDLGLKVLVCINKIDRKDARPDHVLGEIFDLFAALGASDDQLDFPHIYAAARDGIAVAELGDEAVDLEPLFDLILDHCPAPQSNIEAPLQLQVATLSHSPFLGRIGIGRIYEGTIKRGMQAVVLKPGGGRETFRVTKLMSFRGLERVDIDEAYAGDIVALAGAGDATVGDTICAVGSEEALPSIPIEEPTMSMMFQVNTSPFAGTEGKYVTSRQILERLDRELLANVGLRVEQGATPEQFLVSGRGILHLSVLMESMRREGYELAVGQPQVILREIDGVRCEPFKEVSVLCAEAFTGVVIEKLNGRGGEMTEFKVETDGHARLSYTIPSRGLIGYRSEFLTDTRGTGTLVSIFSHYAPVLTRRSARSNGVIIVQDNCTTVGYGLANLQLRGELFLGPGQKTYRGQIIGLHSRENDLVVNPSKAKKLTNVRASGTDDAIKLTPPRIFTLEEALEFIAEDELVEVTPESIRIRKREREHHLRKRA
jgi:GTP-binding protein